MKNSHVYFVVVLIMCSINFFDLQMIKGSPVRYVQFGYLILAILLSLPHVLAKREGLCGPVQLLAGSILLSVFIATFSRGQSLPDSVVGSVPVLVWSVFFYLRRIDFPIRTIEQIVVGYGLLYLVLYAFQFTHPGSNYFIDLETLDDSRGILRIVFPGRGLFYLTIFIAITKLTTARGNRWFWGLLAVIGLMVTVMQVTRQFIFGAVVIYAIHFLKDTGYAKKLLFVAAFAAIAFYVTQSENPIVKGLLDTQDQTQESGTDYVRIRAATFFLTDFASEPFHRVVGSGVPYGNGSPYYLFYKFQVDNYGYWLSDVGLVAIYAMFGIFAVLGYLLIWLKSFTYKLPRSYYYLKYYLWFLLITCLTSDTIYSPNDLIATVLVVYAYQVIHEKSHVVRPAPKHQLA